MGGNPVLPGWDTVILVVPILALLAMMMFKLDERCASPRRSQGARRPFCEVGGSHPPAFSDPDGRLWRKQGIRHVEATLIAVGGPGWDESWSHQQAPPAVQPVIRGYVVENE